MLRNLRLALGNHPEQDGKPEAIIDRVVRNFSRGAAELACSLHWTPDFVRQSIRLEGKEHLDACLRRGRGVIALTAHLGNFALIGTRLAAEGYTFNALIKNPPDRRFAKLLDTARLQIGQKTISARPRIEAAKNVLKSLKHNEIVLIVADEYKHNGISVEFFGHQVPSARGPATLAMRSGAAVVPMFLFWEDEGLRLRVDSSLPLVNSGESQKDIEENTAMFAKCLETAIRNRPDQWNWLNLRLQERRKSVSPRPARF